MSPVNICIVKIALNGITVQTYDTLPTINIYVIAIVGSNKSHLGEVNAK